MEKENLLEQEYHKGTKDLKNKAKEIPYEEGY